MSKNEGVRLRMPNKSEASDEVERSRKKGEYTYKSTDKNREKPKVFREEEGLSKNEGVRLRIPNNSENSDETVTSHTNLVFPRSRRSLRCIFRRLRARL